MNECPNIVFKSKYILTRLRLERPSYDEFLLHAEVVRFLDAILVHQIVCGGTFRQLIPRSLLGLILSLPKS